MKKLVCVLFTLIAVQSFAQQASNESITKAQRLFRRITGVPLKYQDQRLKQMAELIEKGDEEKAAAIATEDPNFYQVTLKNMAAVMSNRTESPFVGLDDFQATFIGAVRDELDARTLLTGNYIYKSSQSRSQPSRNDNRNYEDLDRSFYMGYLNDLVKQEPQWQGFQNYAGLLTTRAWAVAHYDAGTNRRAVVFAIKEFLCSDIEQWKVAQLPDIYIGRDIDRCVGGKFDPEKKRCVGDVNPTVFKNQCQTCHGGMDAMRGAFASMDLLDNTLIELPGGKAAPKYANNATTYPEGYVTKNDSWVIPPVMYETSILGFNKNYPQSGKGLNAFATVLANTSAFKMCMASRVFSQVCQRSAQLKDNALLKVLAAKFEKNNFNLKKLVHQTAVLPACLGE
jgi:hypothetical protein